MLYRYSQCNTCYGGSYKDGLEGISRALVLGLVYGGQRTKCGVDIKEAISIDCKTANSAFESIDPWSIATASLGVVHGPLIWPAANDGKGRVNDN